MASKVAIVTGASRGIGKASAIELARAGYDVVICARSISGQNTHIVIHRPEGSDEEVGLPGTIEETADLIRKAGRQALPVRADLTNMDDVRNVVAQAMQRFGRIDLMMNNARYVSDAHWKMFVDTPWEELERMVDVNVRAVLLFHWLVVPIMIKQGGGVIVNITSGAALNDNPSLPGKGSTGLGYPVTKAAFHRIAMGLAKEVRQHNIAVINLGPGFAMTERVEVETANYGFDLTRTNSVRVPAKVVAHFATCANPLVFSGKYFEARQVAQEFGLMREEELASPYRGTGE